MSIILTLLMVLLCSTGTELEISGDFAAAGYAYSEENDLAGEIRILSRFLEESLYSGNSIHAFNLIIQLESFQIEPSLFDFWYARLSWSCGLSEYACAALDSIQGSMWLESRAKGLASQFRGNGHAASDYFRLSMQHAESARQRYYSALDLSFALIQEGMYEEAEDIAVFLAGNFPGEGIPLISLALSFQKQERYGEAMSILQSLHSGDDFTNISKLFAADLLKDLE